MGSNAKVKEKEKKIQRKKKLLNPGNTVPYKVIRINEYPKPMAVTEIIFASVALQATWWRCEWDW